MTKKSPQRPPPKQGSSPPAPPPRGKSPPATAAPTKPAATIPKPPPKRPMTTAPQPRGERDRSGFQKGVITAEMRATAKGSPTAEDLLLALKYEGKPSHLSDERYLQRFARYGWHDEEDEQARAVLNKWQLETYAIDPNDPFDVIGDMALEQNAEQQQALRQQYLNGELTGPEFVAQSVALYREKRGIENLLSGLEDGTQSPQEYEALLESTLGYNIVLYNCEGQQNSTECEERNIQQMRQIAESNLAILEYIEEVAPGQGIEAFRNFFSENGRVNIYLQAENIVDLADTEGFSGLTPLASDSYDIYLGSQMSVGAITHEFFHQLDRAVQRGAASAIIAPGTSLSQHLNDNFANNTGVPLNEQFIYEVGPYQDSAQPGYSSAQVITGYVGQVAAVGSTAELLADLGMTAVLSGTGEEVLVQLPDGSFVPFEVAWASTRNAADVQAYFDNLMGELFSE